MKISFQTNMKNAERLSLSSAPLAVLIIFSVLAVPLGSASAAEVQIFSNEQREENANTMILDYDDTGGNVTLQFGDSLGEQIYWDNAGGQFVVTDDLNVTLNLDVDGTITAGSSGVQITTAAGNIDGEIIADDTIDEDSLDFGTGAGQIDASDISLDSSGLLNSSATETLTAIDDVDAAVGSRTYTDDNYVTDSESVTASIDALDQQLKTTTDGLTGSTGTTSKTYTLDNDDTGGDVSLIFGTALGETLTWDDAGQEFDLSDDLSITGGISTTGNADFGGTIEAGSGNIQITDATGNLDGSVLITDSVDDTAIDFGTGANQVSAADLTIDSTGLINSSATDTLAAIDDVDASVGTRTYTNDNVVTDSEAIASSIDALDTAFGNRTYTNDNVVTDGETVTASVDAIDTAVGDRTYTDDNIVTDGEALAVSIDALDQALGGTASLNISMNDLTVNADGTANLADLYTDVETTPGGHEYYILKTQQSSLQDLDLKFKIQLPQNFSSFTNANDLSFFYKNTGFDNTDSKIDILVEDDDGDDAFTAGDGQDLFNTNWTEYTDEFDGGAFDPLAGEYIYVTIKGYTSNDGGQQNPYLGEIVLNYTAAGVGS